MDYWKKHHHSLDSESERDHTEERVSAEASSQSKKKAKGAAAGGENSSKKEGVRHKRAGRASGAKKRAKKDKRCKACADGKGNQPLKSTKDGELTGSQGIRVAKWFIPKPMYSTNYIF